MNFRPAIRFLHDTLLTARAPIADIDDIQWLISPEVGELLAQLATSPDGELAQSRRLRATLGPARARLALAQVDLRGRARDKFPLAAQMFFTRIALEQATDHAIAAYKARRFPNDQPIVDLCCGVGGDLLALAARGPTVGVDSDAAVRLLSQENLRVAGHEGRGESILGDVTTRDWREFAAWHIDPDRRAASGRRTTQVEQFQPNAAWMDRLLRDQPAGAIKLAPASQPSPHWQSAAELEWISRGGECRQLVAWFGSLARDSGARRATQVSISGEATASLSGAPREVCTVARHLSGYLHEPDAAVIASQLVGALANQHQLAAIAPGAIYLTSDSPLIGAPCASFQIIAEVPFRERAVIDLVRVQHWSEIEIKQRGVEIHPDTLRRRLPLQGDGRGTLFVTRKGQQVVAIVARRVPSSETL